MVAFIFFVAPGILWELLYERHRPTRVESAFREISRVALFSILPSTVSSAAIFFLCWHLHRDWIKAISHWLERGSGPSSEALFASVVLAILEVTLATAIVWLGWQVYATLRHRGSIRVQRVSAWGLVMEKTTKDEKDEDVFARVTLSNGTIMRGRIRAFTNSFEWSDRELVLYQPLVRINSDAEVIPVTEQFSIIPSASIVEVSVIHVPAVKPSSK